LKGGKDSLKIDSLKMVKRLMFRWLAWLSPLWF